MPNSARTRRMRRIEGRDAFRNPMNRRSEDCNPYLKSKTNPNGQSSYANDFNMGWAAENQDHERRQQAAAQKAQLLMDVLDALRSDPDAAATLADILRNTPDLTGQ